MCVCVCVCVCSHVLLPSCALCCHLLHCALCLPYAFALCHPFSLCHLPSTPHCLRPLALCGPAWFYLLFVPDIPFVFVCVSVREGRESVWVCSHVLLPSCALCCNLLHCALCLPYVSAICHPFSLCHLPSVMCGFTFFLSQTSDLVL